MCPNGLRAVGQSQYDSIMCSTSSERIAEIGQAIDELAIAAEAAYHRAASAGASPVPLREVRSRPELAASAATEPGAVGSGPGGSQTPGSEAAGESSTAAGPEEISQADQVVIRLAQLWERLAELDPEVARRLPTYRA